MERGERPRGGVRTSQSARSVTAGSTSAVKVTFTPRPIDLPLVTGKGLVSGRDLENGAGW